MVLRLTIADLSKKGASMQKYIAKRILFLIPTIIGVTLIIYLIMNITPGDPGRAILSDLVSLRRMWMHITMRSDMTCRFFRNL